MKLTVTKHLNVRVGEPSVNAPCYQYLAPGTELKVDGKLYNGDNYDGISTWYKDKADNYYWSGGVKEPNQIVIQKEDQGSFSEAILKYSGDGSGIGVAILDSGIDLNHVHLKKRIKNYESFLEGKPLKNISHHGTQVAGIITSDDNRVTRNKSDIYCMRVANNKNFIDNYAVQLALKKIDDSVLNTHIKILNMSINIISIYVSRIQPIINSLLDKGIIAVVAAGENGQLNEISRLENVIKVGVFSQNSYERLKEKGIPKDYSFAFLDIPIPSYKVGGSEIDSKIDNDSAYCAFVSAILSREWSNKLPSKKTRLEDAISFLSNNSIQLVDSVKAEPYQIYT